MRTNNGKWYLLLLLIVCLGALVIIASNTEKKTEAITTKQEDKSISTDEITNDVITKRKIKLENETLYLKNQGRNTLYIGGNGCLVQDDFTALLKNEGILEGEVTNLIIGPDIAEIGYKTLTDLPYLRTLKFSDGLKKIGNGSVVNNKVLEYVYVPDSVEYLGIDFLSGSEEPYVITNGDILSLELKCVKKDHILKNIHTFSDLKEKISNTHLVFDYKELLVSSPEKTEGPYLIVHPGYGQYGPDTFLQEGKYFVVYEGIGFSGLTEESIRVCDAEKEDFAIQGLSIQNDRVSFSFEATQVVSKLNFVMMNDKTDPIRINCILVYPSDYYLPKEIEEGWF